MSQFLLWVSSHDGCGGGITALGFFGTGGDVAVLGFVLSPRGRDHPESRIRPVGHAVESH